MIISDFVEWELEKFRNECNFTEEELDFFNYRAKNISDIIEEQQYQHEKYKCKIKEMAAEKLY